MKWKWDVRNPDHRRALETARVWGVSPSQFMGAETVIRTEHFDGGTRQVMSPAWTEEDRIAAIELQNWEASLCPQCRQPLAETTDVTNEFKYHVTNPERCHACTAVALKSDEYSDTVAPHALFFQPKLTEG